MYPFTLITSIGIGLSYRRLRTVIYMTLLLAGSYALSAHVLHRDPLWNVTPNSASYFANTVVAWLVARQLRSSGKDADRNRAQAVARADELAQERERARHARLLHDRVLQSLETLARGDWLPDANLRAHLAAEASWLRALVEGTPLDQPDDLLTALQTVVQRWARTGLRVDFNSTQLHDALDWRKNLTVSLVEALADATGEALANVAKHAGVDSATVRITVTDRELIVSILDHGRGFDQTTARRGIGLAQSITMRMNGVGCQAQVNSAPGNGTYVELCVPRTAC
jgi:signal transduction histidine kinase